MKTLQQILRQILQLISSLRCNIYGIVDPRNPQEYRYVGKTPYSIEERLTYHIWESNRKGKNKIKTYKCDWIRKLLKDNITPIIILIDIVPSFQWKYWEKHYIKLYKNLGHRLTNATDGGDGGSGYVWSEEQRKFQSETRSGKNHPMFGKVSPMKDKHYTEESNRRRRKKMKGKMSGKNHPMFSKKQSEESNKKRSETLKAKMFGKNHPSYGKVSSRKNKTYEEIYGEEKAKKMKSSLSKVFSGKKLSEKHKDALKEGWKKRKERLNKVA